MIVIPCEQNTEDWKLKRVGKASTSRCGCYMARTKSGWSASRNAYKAEKVTERFTGIPYPSYVNDSMAWGTAHQDDALSLYCLREGVTCETVGLVQHPTIEDFVSSPDAICGDGLVEVKCPNTSTMLDQLLNPETIERKYLLQCLGQLSCCPEKKWVDLVYFDPRLPPSLQMLIRRIERSDHTKLIEEIEDLTRVFLTEVAEDVMRLRSMYETGEQTNGQSGLNTKHTKRAA